MCKIITFYVAMNSTIDVCKTAIVCEIADDFLKIEWKNKFQIRHLQF